MKLEKDGIIKFECSAREMYVNCHIIGIDPELEVSGGYDQGNVDHYHIYNKQKDEYEKITKEERTELANYMIGLWTKYKDQL